MAARRWILSLLFPTGSRSWRWQRAAIATSYSSRSTAFNRRWFISRGVVAEELDRGELIEIPTGVRFLSGAVGITRRQADTTSPGIEHLVQLCHEAAATL